MTLNNNSSKDFTFANTLQDVNVYVDDCIAFTYPADILLHKPKSIKNYDLEKGNLHIHISISDKDKWQANQDSYIYSFQMKEIDFGKDSVFLRNNVQLEKYNDHGFNGLAIKFYNMENGTRTSIHKTELFIHKGGNYLYVSANNIPQLPDVLNKILKSAVFPGESSYSEIFAKGPKIKIIETPNSINLPEFLKFGDYWDSQRSRFNVNYESLEISKPQQQAIKTLINNEKDIFKQSKEEIFKYYTQNIYPLYVKEGLVDGPSSLPEINSIDEILPLVSLSEVYVHSQQNDGTVPIGLRFHCLWGDDGLGLKIINNNVVAIGNDYVALDAK